MAKYRTWLLLSESALTGGSGVSSLALVEEKRMTDPDESVNQGDADAQAIELSGAMMAHLAGNMSEKFDTFATWLLAGFGAAVALLLTSHEVSGLVAAPTIRYGAKLFLAAVGVAVLQKYISIIVTGGSEGGDFARTARILGCRERRTQERNKE